MRKEKKCMTYLALPDAIRRMAGMAAARKGLSVSTYVAELIHDNCERSGIANLLADQDDKEVKP